MPFCSQCGNENPENAGFCGKCGKPTKQVTQQAKPKPKSEPKTSPVEFVTNAVKGISSRIKKEDRKKFALITAGAVIGVMVISFAVYFAGIDMDEEDEIDDILSENLDSEDLSAAMKMDEKPHKKGEKKGEKKTEKPRKKQGGGKPRGKQGAGGTRGKQDIGMLREKARKKYSESSFTDSRDDKQYRAVTIDINGRQTWMAENLNYDAKGSKCYDNDQSNCEKYGRLYDWKTAMKACPSGWHLPSLEEWRDKLFSGDWRSSDPWKTTSGWDDYSDYFGRLHNGTDEYGFSALMGSGEGYKDGSFKSFSRCKWWSSSDGYSGDNFSIKRFRQWLRHIKRNFYYAYAVFIDNDSALPSLGDDKRNLYSVRCLKDEPILETANAEPEKEDPSIAIIELEQEAKEWQEGIDDVDVFRFGEFVNPYKSNDGIYFSFKESGNKNKAVWTATSKMQIGDCPANSVWKMTANAMAGTNTVPSKCKAITPKIITNHRYDNAGCDGCFD